MTKIASASAGSILLLLLLGSSAFALSAGALRINPYASIRETMTDNVFSTPTDEKSDLLSAFTPGVKSHFPFLAHKADLDFHAVLTRYDKYREERTDDYFGSGFIDLRFGGHMSLLLSDVYMKSHKPRSSSATGFIEKYTTNAAKASLAYQIVDRSKVQVDYIDSYWNYEQGNFQDRHEDLIVGSISYRFQPKTSAFVEYDLKNVTYSDASSKPLDNNMQSALLGISWDVTTRSKGTVKLGQTWKEYDDPSVEDYDTWTGRIDMDHHFDEHNAIKLAGLREINETNYFEPGAQLPIRFFVTTGVSVEASHKFGYRTTGFVVLVSGTDKFSDPSTDPADGKLKDRKDSTLSFGLGLKYQVKDWLEVGVDYLSRDRDSNINANDYTEHRYSLTLSALF